MMNKLLAVLLTLPLTSPAFAGVEDELLEPDKAFSLTTRVVDANTLEASWKIAPGYYMYRDKFKFEVLDEEISLKPPVLPPGKKKSDPLFGTVETYTKSVRVQLPIERNNTSATATQLKITAQGCNEPVGVCYPPLIKQISFNLPAMTTLTPKIPLAKVNSLKDFAKTIDTEAMQQEVIDPEQAFILHVEPRGGDALQAHFDIADCCYLYRDKTRFELTQADGNPLPPGIKLGAYTLPPGEVKTDEFIGKTEVYHNGFDVRLLLEGLRDQPIPLALKVTYQGCSEKGVAICYPPTTKKFSVVPSSSGSLVVTAAGDRLRASVADTDQVGQEHPRRDTGKFILAIVAAFGTGLLLTFTPCVLPMIPILSSIIVGQGDEKITKLKGGLLSSSYVLGTAVTYTIGGALAGATGKQLQAYFQNIWAIGTFSVIFVLLALSMFGFYELQMPGFIQSRLHSRTQRLKGGSLIGVFLLGLVSALIVGACVSPLLISALGVAIASHDPILGAAIMFSMALGMGAILIAIGIGAGFLLPRAGVWMDQVKQIFGVLLLAVAIYLLGLLPEVPVLFLWAAFFMIIGVYLGATQSLPPGVSGWRYLWKGIGTFLFVWGVLALLGALNGNRDILNPLPLAMTGGGITVSTPTGVGTANVAQPLFERVQNLGELEGRLNEARASGRPVILDYYATWCTDCVRMEKTTFADATVRAELRNKRYVLLQADVTDPNNPDSEALKQRFGVYGPPAMLFFSANGEELRNMRTYGYKSVSEFLAMLRKI